MPRERMFEAPQSELTTTNDHEWGFITGFNAQYKEIEAIFSRYWHILKLDKNLGPVLPANPKFIYRKSKNMGDHIVARVLDPPSKPSMFWEVKGFYNCRGCRACKECTPPPRGMRDFTSPANGRCFDINWFLT